MIAATYVVSLHLWYQWYPVECPKCRIWDVTQPCLPLTTKDNYRTIIICGWKSFHRGIIISVHVLMVRCECRVKTCLKCTVNDEEGFGSKYGSAEVCSCLHFTAHSPPKMHAKHNYNLQKCMFSR